MPAWNLQKIGCCGLRRGGVGFFIGIGQLDTVVAFQNRE
jgi:hypothetical protein